MIPSLKNDFCISPSSNKVEHVLFTYLKGTCTCYFLTQHSFQSFTEKSTHPVLVDFGAAFQSLPQINFSSPPFKANFHLIGCP